MPNKLYEFLPMRSRTGHPQVVIFDLDDTLYKEIDFVNSAYHHIDRLLVAEYDIKPGSAFRVLSKSWKSGLNPMDELNRHLELKGIHIPDAIRWMVDEYRYHVPTLKLDNNTRLALNIISGLDIPMYIITDGRSITQRNKIRALGLNEFIPWENVFISEEQGKDKVSPHSFSKIRERYRPKPDDNEYIFVGDNPAKDFIVANRFGCTSIQLADDGRNIHHMNLEDVDKSWRPEFTIYHITELHHYINFTRGLKLF